MQNQYIKVIILTVIVLGVLGGLIAYFYLWLPSDSDYKSAATNVSDMRVAANTIEKSLGGDATSSLITSVNVGKLQKAVNTYNKSLQAVGSAKVLHDSKVADVYNQYSASLSNFGKVASNSVEDETTYLSVAASCSHFEGTAYLTLSGILNDNTRYAKEKESCQKAVSDAQKLSDSTFKTQFLSPYASNKSEMVTKYQKIVDDLNAKRIQKTQALNDARNAAAELDSASFSIPNIPPTLPTQALDKLTTAIGHTS